MSQLVARLLLAIMVFPISIVLFVLSLFAYTRGNAPTLGTASGAWATVLSFIALYWLWVWKDVVRWTRWRRLLTLIAGAGAIGFSAAVAILINDAIQVPGAAVMLSGTLAPIAWVFSTILIWRESRAERMERVRNESAGAVSCPLCGYNLTGLREARCPECGGQFTLQDLLHCRSQAHAEDRHLEASGA